jgi:hypothetical protein
LAYNQKPKRPQKTGKTRREIEQIINHGTAQLQASLIAYECLQSAVKLDSHNEQIKDKATELYNIEISRITEGK